MGFDAHQRKTLVLVKGAEQTDQKMATTRTQALQLYKQFMRNGRNYNGYNVREYIQRRVRDEFKQNKDLTNPADIEKSIAKAQRELELVKRQTIISRLYNHGRLVIE